MILTFAKLQRNIYMNIRPAHFVNIDLYSIILDLISDLKAKETEDPVTFAK